MAYASPDTRSDSQGGRGDDSWHGAASRLLPSLPSAAFAVLTRSNANRGGGGEADCEMPGWCMIRVGRGGAGKGRRQQLARLCPQGDEGKEGQHSRLAPGCGGWCGMYVCMRVCLCVFDCWLRAPWPRPLCLAPAGGWWRGIGKHGRERKELRGDSGSGHRSWNPGHQTGNAIGMGIQAREERVCDESRLGRDGWV